MPRDEGVLRRGLAQPSVWFASPELDVWDSMLRRSAFRCRADDHGLSGRSGGRRDIRLDLSTLETLFADLGVETSLAAAVPRMKKLEIRRKNSKSERN